LVNQALMELGATYCAPAGSGIDDRDPLRDYYLSTQLGRAYLAVLQEGGSELIDDICSPLPSAITPTKTKAESKKKCCEICDPDGIHIVFESFRGLIASNTTMEEAAKIGHSTFPTDPPKKDKREEDLAMAVLLNRSQKCDGADADDSVRYLMVRRPREGLLAGQWEFPNVCVRIRKKNIKKKTDSATTTTKGPKKAERYQALTKFLLEDLFHDHPNDEVATGVSNLSRQVETKPLEHIFSHVKHYMWVEVGDFIDIHLGDDDLDWITASGKEARWMNKDDMKKVGITSGVKKVLQSVEKSTSSTSKSKPNKRKR
jgi:A/G-specific adenine glycosylase